MTVRTASGNTGCVLVISTPVMRHAVTRVMLSGQGMVTASARVTASGSVVPGAAIESLMVPRAFRWVVRVQMSWMVPMNTRCPWGS